jgi:5-methylcytosine-specific restriction endonuclease McrA
MTSESIVCKRCSKCGEIKPLDAFSRQNRSKDGRRGECKECVAAHYSANADAKRAYQRSYYKVNSQAVLAYQRFYQATNAEAISEYKRAYHAANAEAKRAYMRKYYTDNREAILEYWRTYRITKRAIRLARKRAYYSANREAVLERQRAYYVTHLDVSRAAGQRRRTRKKANGGDFSSKELRAMRIAQAGICAYCQRQHDPDVLHIDHIIPIAQGGPHQASNICLACSRCNRNKSNCTPGQWVNRWYHEEKD